MSVEMLIVKGFLVVKASGEMRVMKGRSPLRLDEIAFPITVSIPRQWGRVQEQRIELTMPEPPDALVQIDAPEEVDG